MSKRKAPHAATPAASRLSLPDTLEQRPFWHIIILLLVPFFIYIKTVNFDLLPTEEMALIQNNLFTFSSWKSIGQAFQRDIFWGHSSPFYRPVETISFIIDTKLGAARASIYHLSNLIFHLLTVLFLYLLLISVGIRRLPAFLLALFFALHPLLAGAVAWLPARADLLAGLGSVLAFLFFDKYRKNGQFIHLLLHWLFFFLAVFAKETALLLPLLFTGYYLFTEKKLRARITLPVAGWLCALTLYVFLKNNATRGDLFSIETIRSSLTVLPLLLAKVFIPVRLSTMPLSDNSFIILGSLLLMVLLIVAVYQAARKKWLPATGLVWFILLLVASLTIPYRDTRFLQSYSESIVYLPLAGLILLLAWGLDWLLLQRSRTVYFFLCLLVLIVFLPATSVYSDNYKNAFSYYGRAIELDNPGAYTKRGEAYVGIRDFDNAKADFESAIDLSKGLYAPAYYGLGKVAAVYDKNHQDAAFNFTQAILLDSTTEDPYIDRAMERLSLQDAGGAIEDLDKAKSLDSTDARIYYSLGKVHIAAAQFEPAAEDLSRAIKLDSFYTDAYGDRALAYYQLKNYPDALRDCNKAIALNSAFFTAYYNKAMIYYALNQPDKTVKLLDTTLALANNFYFGYFYRGMAKKQLHDIKGACSDWQEAVSLGFTMAQDTLNVYCK